MDVEQVSQHPRVAENNCLTSHTARKILIYDHPTDGRCYIRQRGEDTTPFDFTLHNARSRVFHFVQVDKCMFSDEEDANRCDCLFFTDSISLFVELKGNKSVSGRQKGRNKAINQLCASVAWFLVENLLADGAAVEVIVANGTRKRHPRFNESIIDKTLAIQQLFPNLSIRYGELPFYKL